jgi:type IV pilus assembly protein PilB
MGTAAGDLAHILLERGVAANDLERALANHYDSGRPFVATLFDREIVSDADLAAALAHQLGIELVDLTTYRIDRLATEMIAPSFCRRHVLLPVAIHEGRLVVAMADPGDLIALDDVRLASGMATTPAVAARDQILLAIDRYVARDSDLEDLASVTDGAIALPDLASLVEVAGESPMIRYVNSLLTGAVGDGASDVHVEPGERNVRVRYRIDGVLHEIAELPKSIQPALLSRLKVMAEINIAERRIPQDGRLTLAVSGRQVDVRVATLPTVWGEKIVLRVLDNSGVRLDLDQMGFGERNAARLGSAIARPFGLVLVTGPTGSGKTTTLYGALNRISTSAINVITVEDPVEYRLAGVNQVQVNPKASLTFASALRAILRTDPDVVLVGEIRDRETAQIGVEAALTGHLVLSTMHTNDAPSAVTRLVEIGIEPFLVGSSVACVLAQRLVRRLCERCKVAVDLDSAELLSAGYAESRLPGAGQLFRPAGCAHCAHIGYRGRMAIHEVMEMSEQMEHLTVTGAPTSQIAAAAREEGMATLRDDGLAKAAAGLTSVEEILRVVG